jgi:hypothetical protein
LTDKIGGIVVHKPQDATHMIIGAEFKRTAKVMIAINCGIQYIVQLNWLQDSVKIGKPIPLTSASALQKYIAKDTKKEKLWGFQLKSTLSMPRGHVFQNVNLFVIEGVCGVCAPCAEDMKEIIVSGGGTWITDWSTISTTNNSSSCSGSGTTQVKKKARSETSIKMSKSDSSAATLAANDESPLINKNNNTVTVIISSEEVTKTLKSTNRVLFEFLSTNSFCMHSPEFVFSAVFRQILNFKEHQLHFPVLMSSKKK